MFLEERLHQKRGSAFKISGTLQPWDVRVSFCRFFKERVLREYAWHRLPVSLVSLVGMQAQFRASWWGEGRAWQGGCSCFQPHGWDSSK